MVRPIPYVNQRPDESKSQRKRRNILRHALPVFQVGEQLSTLNLMHRMIEAWGAGHHSIPKNTNALGQCLKGSEHFEKIRITKGINEWRRIE